MSVRGRGGIIFTSSTTVFSPAVLWANYSASKAYELALGEAMHAEMRPKGVDVVVVCSGPSPIGLYDVASQDLARLPRAMRMLVVELSEVVDTVLQSFGRKRSVIVGWGNRLVQQLGRVVPRSFASRNVSAFVASVRRG